VQATAALGERCSQLGLIRGQRALNDRGSAHDAVLAARADVTGRRFVVDLDLEEVLGL